MNTTFLEVLKEVHLGILIIEPNMRWNRRKSKRGWPRTTAKVSSWSGFLLFGCHKEVLCVCVREREREREKERIETQHKFRIERRKRMHAWKMHEHVTCKSKHIIGDTQSNPSNTHINNQAHTSNYAWNIVIVQMECKVWAYDVRFTTPNPQYYKKLKNPKNIEKTPKT